jgi:Tfp pilus assembly protein PilX
MRKLSILMVLVGMLGFTVPQQSFSQQRPGERRERQSRDVEADVQRARQALENAKNQLEAAGHEWGGHRVAAINHVNAALAECAKAEQWARQHKEIK